MSGEDPPGPSLVWFTKVNLKFYLFFYPYDVQFRKLPKSCGCSANLASSYKLAPSFLHWTFSFRALRASTVFVETRRGHIIMLFFFFTFERPSSVSGLLHAFQNAFANLGIQPESLSFLLSSWTWHMCVCECVMSWKHVGYEKNNTFKVVNLFQLLGGDEERHTDQNETQNTCLSSKKADWIMRNAMTSSALP